MKSTWRQNTILLSAAAVLLTACGAGYEEGIDHEGDEYAYGDESLSEESGIVLGTSRQGLSYPTCASASSDPDRDGWGWENNMSCKVATTSTTTYPTCASASSDPDGDGWGWENQKSCIVKTTTTTPTGTSGSCANLEGTASTMAAIAVSAAMELKRWQPTKDFVIGKIGTDEALLLTTAGKARCSDGKCFNTQALLDFQKNEANGKIRFPNNVTINSSALRSRLVAKFRDQLSCEAQPSNGGTTNCPVEEHTLTFQRSEKGGCDTNYFFVAKKPDGKPLQYPAQLKNKLRWADTVNPYIGFQSVGEVVSIDPTYGLNEAGSASTGSCTAACAKISALNVAGACCACNGLTKAFAKSAWSTTTFLCQ